MHALDSDMMAEQTDKSHSGRYACSGIVRAGRGLVEVENAADVPFPAKNLQFRNLKPVRDQRMPFDDPTRDTTAKLL